MGILVKDGGIYKATRPGLQGIYSRLSRWDSAAEIEWEYATSVDRDNQLMVALAASLGLAEEQLDDLFMAASGI